jgi:hypothetical protein
LRNPSASPEAWIQELRVLNAAYAKAVKRFIKTRELKEMKSIAAEMRALSIETETLMKQFLSSRKLK